MPPLAEGSLWKARELDLLVWITATSRAAQLGSEHPSVIAFQMQCGRALIAAGRPREAATVLDRTFRANEKARGADDLGTLDALGALADACLAAGEPADAIRLYRRVLTDRERVQGPADPQTLASGQKLGDVYLASKKFKEALANYKRVVEDRERSLGPAHPATIEARDRLASAYHAVGQGRRSLRRLPSLQPDRSSESACQPHARPAQPYSLEIA